MKPFDPDLYERFIRIAATLSRGSGSGKHRNGRCPPRNHRLQRRRRRKAQRQARRRARLCASGRKHRA